MIEINGYNVIGRTPIFTGQNRDLIRRNIKTQTRRVIRGKPGENISSFDLHGQDANGAWWFCSNGEPYGPYKFPYGAIGDIRVVPEPLFNNSGLAFYQYHHIAPVLVGGNHVEWTWKTNTLSSMFMPTWAGRTIVRYTDIRVERLQDISAKDAMAEGMLMAHIPINKMTIEALDKSSSTGLAAIEDFIILWDSINGKKHPWELNLWVWVLEWELLDRG